LFKKLRLLLVLPVALFMGAIGWSLTWIDSANNSKVRRPKTSPRAE
jgi:hypothetical protein